MHAFSFDDVPAKAGSQIPHDLPIQLRQLLVMVNGSRSVRELLGMGLRGVELVSFDVLRDLGLIHRARAAAAAPVAPIAPSRRGLSEARFAVIDVLLDLSTHDFAVRPWVERMEKASSIESLVAEVQAFVASPIGARSAPIHARLRRAFD